MELSIIQELLGYFGAFAFGLGIMFLWLKSTLAEIRRLRTMQDAQHTAEIERYAQFVSVSENQNKVIERLSLGHDNVATLVRQNTTILEEIRRGLDAERSARGAR